MKCNIKLFMILRGSIFNEYLELLFINRSTPSMSRNGRDYSKPTYSPTSSRRSTLLASEDWEVPEASTGDPGCSRTKGTTACTPVDRASCRPQGTRTLRLSPSCYNSNSMPSTMK